jgi:hypothetical protein
MSMKRRVIIATRYMGAMEMSMDSDELMIKHPQYRLYAQSLTLQTVK